MAPKRDWRSEKNWPEQTWQRYDQRRDWDTWTRVRHDEQHPTEEPSAKWAYMMGAGACGSYMTGGASSSSSGPQAGADRPAEPSDVALSHMKADFQKLIDTVISKPAAFEPKAYTAIVAGRPTQVFNIDPSENCIHNYSLDLLYL